MCSPWWRKNCISAAALRLGIAQPPLSQQIKKLEDLVGHKLFLRDTRSVDLTEAGQALLALTRKMLETAALGLVKVRQAGKGEAGMLNLGFTATTALEMLPKILGSLRARWPEIQVNLLEMLPDSLLEALGSEQIDAALARELINTEDFEVLALFREPYVAVLPASHPCAARAGPLKLASLREDDFILYPRDHDSRNADQLLAMCREAGFTPRASQQAPGWQTAVSFVGSGLGVTILPSCVRSFRLPNVIYRDLETDAASTIQLLRRPSDTRALVQNFCTLAREAIHAFPAT